MVEAGSRVRLRPGSQIVQRNPDMADAIGIVGSVVHGPAWRRLGVPEAERLRDVAVHVRFGTLNLVALNVPATDVEAVDHIDPQMPG